MDAQRTRGPELLANAALVGAGGAIGALARILTVDAFDLAHLSFALFLVNLFGSILLAALTAAAVPDRWRLVLGTGLCGGFTTYSAFAGDVLTNFGDDPWHTTWTSLAVLVFGLVGSAIGWRAGTLLRAQRRQR